MKIFLATGSEHKREEWTRMFNLTSTNRSLFPDEKEDVFVYLVKGINLETEETGTTLYENAYEKALSAYKQMHDMGAIKDELVLADDTGLFVEAFGGPGVASKRGKVAGPENILKAFENFYAPTRTANITTVACLMKDEKHYYFYTSSMHGYLNDKLSKVDGYVYDRIFVPYNTYTATGMRVTNSKCLAELNEDDKDRAAPRYSIAVQILQSLHDFEKE